MNKMLKVMPLIILSLVLMGTSCQPLSDPPEETTPTASEETSTPASEEGTQIGNRAPDFELQDLDGQSISLSSLRGSPVMLNFWASWCPPCRYEMPFIQEVYDEWSDKGLMVLAINLEESASTAKQFMQAEGLSFPVLLDTRSIVAGKYNIRAIPTTFLIDKDGIIQGIKIGAFQSKEEIETSIRMVIE